MDYRRDKKHTRVDGAKFREIRRDLGLKQVQVESIAETRNLCSRVENGLVGSVSTAMIESLVSRWPEFKGAILDSDPEIPVATSPKFAEIVNGAPRSKGMLSKRIDAGVRRPAHATIDTSKAITPPNPVREALVATCAKGDVSQEILGRLPTVGPATAEFWVGELKKAIKNHKEIKAAQEGAELAMLEASLSGIAEIQPEKVRIFVDDEFHDVPSPTNAMEIKKLCGLRGELRRVSHDSNGKVCLIRFDQAAIIRPKAGERFEVQ